MGTYNDDSFVVRDWKSYNGIGISIAWAHWWSAGPRPISARCTRAPCTSKYAGLLNQFNSSVQRDLTIWTRINWVRLELIEYYKLLETPIVICIRVSCIIKSVVYLYWLWTSGCRRLWFILKTQQKHIKKAKNNPTVFGSCKKFRSGFFFMKKILR